MNNLMQVYTVKAMLYSDGASRTKDESTLNIAVVEGAPLNVVLEKHEFIVRSSKKAPKYDDIDIVSVVRVLDKVHIK